MDSGWLRGHGVHGCRNMELITLEIDDDGCGRLQFELPADATDEEVAHGATNRNPPRAKASIADVQKTKSPARGRALCGSMR
jgi:hypothetical protein